MWKNQKKNYFFIAFHKRVHEEEASKQALILLPLSLILEINLWTL